jgi:hypothetical protein
MLTNEDKFCSKHKNVDLLKSFKIKLTSLRVINNKNVDNF